MRTEYLKTSVTEVFYLLMLFMNIYAPELQYLQNLFYCEFENNIISVSQKTKNRNKAYEVEEIESKLQQEQRRNELLQERIDLMQEQLIGSAAANSLALDVSSSLWSFSLHLYFFE
jgi:hypothetical protein